MRNALVVVAASLVAFSWDAYGHHVFTLTGETSQGLPPFRPPPTSDVTANGTIVSFGDIVKVSEMRSKKLKLLLIHSYSPRIPGLGYKGVGGGFDFGAGVHHIGYHRKLMLIFHVTFNHLSKNAFLFSRHNCFCLLCSGLWRRACCHSLYGSVGEHCYSQSFW